VFDGTQATHWLVVVSQIWCIGSHAAQSPFELQEMSGSPWLSVSQVRSSSTQMP
jgi:hypothetical protein